MTIKRNSLSDAFFLGLCSLATQTVFLRFILSSEIGGELYAALALGGWILWVGLGSIIGSRFRKSVKPWLWISVALVKIPLAVLIFAYPAFFTGIVDPLRFLPLAMVGMAYGLFYGMIFAVLLNPELKTSIIYRNEAIGSVIGGSLATVWIIVGGGDFGLLILVSILELSRNAGSRLLRWSFAILGIVAAIFAGRPLDMFASTTRWRGFDVLDVADGLSGRWEALGRGDQLTIAHNGNQIATIPDRPSSEDALLWPLLYHPEPKTMLLIGYEGVPVDSVIPEWIDYLCIYNDRAFMKLEIGESSKYEIVDPLRFSAPDSFDIVCVADHGAGSLGDYREETGMFYNRCRSFLNDDGILFVTAPSDENYLSSHLAEYLSSIFVTLKGIFDSVNVIPGPRAGFMCFADPSDAARLDDPAVALGKLGINSPYFNPPLIRNRLSDFRISRFISAMNNLASPNRLDRPESVLRYLSWRGSVFGRSGVFFQIYRFPYILIPMVLLLMVPLAAGAAKWSPYGALYGVTLFGFTGMAFEVVVIYLFSVLFGSLYLNLGLLLALFMIGLAAGAGLSEGLKSIIPISVILLGAALTASISSFYQFPLGLKTAFILLYIISMGAGFATGGGFGIFVNRYGAGAILYGADLYGAMTAAILIPGILMTWGITSAAALIAAGGVIISATLFNKKE